MQSLRIGYFFFAWKELFKQRSNLFHNISEFGRKTTFWLFFSFTVHVFVRLFWRHQYRQRSGFLDLKSEINLYSSVPYKIVFTNKCHKHNMLNLLPAVYFYYCVHEYMGRVKRILYISPMQAEKVQASLRIRVVSPEPHLLAHTSSESRGTFRQKARSLAPLNGWACAVKFVMTECSKTQIRLTRHILWITPAVRARLDSTHKTD